MLRKLLEIRSLSPRNSSQPTPTVFGQEKTTTQVTEMILVAAKDIALSQALLDYFARNVKDGEVLFPLFKESKEEVYEQDVLWLFEHCEVMGTVGMVRQQPEMVRRMIEKAFALVNGKRIVRRHSWGDNARLCVCSAAESLSSIAHDLGFDDIRNRIIGSAYCRSGPTSVRGYWESYPRTPEALRDYFLEYGEVRAGNILERLLPEEAAKASDPQRGLR